MGVDYYYKDGTPIPGDFMEAVKIWGPLHNDMNYRRIGDTYIGGFRVSTVWLGLDHGFGDDGPPIIFETLVFRQDGSETDYDEVGGNRYATEQEAINGHNTFVDLINKGLFVPYETDLPEYYEIEEELLP